MRVCKRVQVSQRIQLVGLTVVKNVVEPNLAFVETTGIHDQQFLLLRQECALAIAPQHLLQVLSGRKQ